MRKLIVVGLRSNRSDGVANNGGDVFRQFFSCLDKTNETNEYFAFFAHPLVTFVPLKNKKSQWRMARKKVEITQPFLF